MPFRGFLLFTTPRKPCLRTVLSGRILQGLPSSPGGCKKHPGPQGQRSNIWALDRLLKLPDQEKSLPVFGLFAHKVSVIPAVSAEPGGGEGGGGDHVGPHLPNTQPPSGHLPWKRWSGEPRESPRRPPEGSGQCSSHESPCPLLGSGLAPQQRRPGPRHRPPAPRPRPPLSFPKQGRLDSPVLPPQPQGHQAFLTAHWCPETCRGTGRHRQVDRAE